MSGGSHDYAYIKLESIADGFYPSYTYVEQRKKIAKILRLMSEVCHDVEWIDSGDYGEDDWVKVIEMLDKITIDE